MCTCSGAIASTWAISSRSMYGVWVQAKTRIRRGAPAAPPSITSAQPASGSM